MPVTPRARAPQPTSRIGAVDCQGSRLPCAVSAAVTYNRMIAEANPFVLSRKSSDNRILLYTHFLLSAFCLFQRFSFQFFRFSRFAQIKCEAAKHLRLAPAVHRNIVPTKCSRRERKEPSGLIQSFRIPLTTVSSVVSNCGKRSRSNRHRLMHSAQS